MKFAPELAEGLGAFAIVLVGAGAIMASDVTGVPDHTGIAIAFGLVVGAMIYASGHLSGAHFNPAVTIAFAATGHFPWRRVPSYVAAQFLGGILGALALSLAFTGHTTFGQTDVSPAIEGVSAGFVIEALITMLLMFVIAAVATDGRAVGKLAGSAIGGTVAMNALWAGPLTGASMNPARSLGPALVGGTWDLTPLWMYMVAPVIGALVGATLYEILRQGSRPEGRR